MVAYSIVILVLFFSSILVPIKIAEEQYENDRLKNKKLSDTVTDTFFMKR